MDLWANSDLEGSFVVLVGDLQKRQQKDLQIQDWKGRFYNQQLSVRLQVFGQQV